MDPVAVFILLMSGVLALGTFGEYVFRRTGLPDVVWLVAAGILVGPVIGIVSVDLVEPALPFCGAVSLIVILSSGSFRMRLREVRSTAPRAITLAGCTYLGAVLAVWLFCRGAEYFQVMNAHSNLEYIIFGSIVGGSSALIIVPTLAGTEVDPRVARLLEIESTLTDVLCVVITLTLVDTYLRGATGMSGLAIDLGAQVGFGVAFGVIGGAVGVAGLHKLRTIPQAYSLILAGLMLEYSITSVLEGSAALAVMLTGIMIGNAREIRERLGYSTSIYVTRFDAEARGMEKQMSFLAKSFFFLLIGLLFPTDARSIVIGFIIALMLLCFRMAASVLALRGAGFSTAQGRLVAIAVPRGLAAGVLSTMPYYRGMTELEYLYLPVFACIVSTIFIFTILFAFVSKRQEAVPAESAAP